MMTDRNDILSTGGRPKSLIRAARMGLVDYDRRRALKRLLGTVATAGPSATLDRLTHLEADVDHARRSGAPGYSALRHIELLIALIFEERLVRA